MSVCLSVLTIVASDHTLIAFVWHKDIRGAVQFVHVCIVTYLHVLALRQCSHC